MKHYRIIKGKKIHVNQLASESRKRTVKHIGIPKSSMPSTGEWEQKKHKEPKSMCKKHTKWITIKENGVYSRIKKTFPSTFPPIQRVVQTKEEKMEIHERMKLEKWEKRNPRPVPEDGMEKDIFENQFVPEWEARREKEIQRIRDFVVSVYDKVKLNGRFEKPGGQFIEKEVAEIKDNGDGNKINEVCPTKSKLMKQAKKLTNALAKKDKTLVCTHIKDNKGEKGSIILPDRLAA